MQDVDRVDHVEPLPEPARARRVGIQVETAGLVLRSQRVDGIGRNRGSGRRLGQEPAVRSKELKIAVRPPDHAEALFMDGAMVLATERGQVRERRGPALRPVLDVMALDEAASATRETTSVIAMRERAS